MFRVNGSGAAPQTCTKSVTVMYMYLFKHHMQLEQSKSLFKFMKCSKNGKKSMYEQYETTKALVKS